MRSTSHPDAVRLRATPVGFRVLMAVGAGLVMTGYLLVLRQTSGPTPAQLIGEPGFLLLAALVLLSDLYPLVPSMRDVRANVTFAWSAALSLAAVLAYGPSASLLFLVSGLTAALSRRSLRWWQTILNMIMFGVIGLAVAGLARWAETFDPLIPAGAWRLAVWGLLLAAVVVVLYALLMGLSLTRLRASTWHQQRDRFGKSVRIWGVSLITAPLLAVLALEGPWALPSMAVVIVSLNHLSSTMLRSTAASRTDGLTGLANRLTLTRRLAARIAGLNGREMVTLLLIDLNRFKDVNDTYGHLVGDEVLIAIAHRLEAAAAPADLVARYGGDEFAVILGPGTSAGRAATTAATFRAALAEPVAVGGVRVVVGGAVGVAESADPDVDVLRLVEQADRDMYRAKRRLAPGRPAVRGLPGAPATAGTAAGPAAGAVHLTRSGSPGPRREPVWSMTVQGSATSPAAGWPGVQWSSSWSGVPGSVSGVWAAGGVR